jgi:hypothetical protein
MRNGLARGALPTVRAALVSAIARPLLPALLAALVAVGSAGHALAQAEASARDVLSGDDGLRGTRDVTLALGGDPELVAGEEEERRAAVEPRNPTRATVRERVAPQPLPPPAPVRPRDAPAPPDAVLAGPEISRLPAPAVRELGALGGVGEDPALEPDTTDMRLLSPIPEEERDPYAPLGLTVGNLGLFPALEIRGGHSTDRAGGTEEGRPSSFVRAVPELRLQSNWSRHALFGRALLSHTEYRDGEAETAAAAEAGVRIDVTRDFALTAEAEYDRAPVERGEDEAPRDVVDRPYRDRTRLAVEAAQRFNRVRVSVRATHSVLDYEDAVRADGTMVENDASDRRQDEVRLRASYELSPKTEIFAAAYRAEEEFERARGANSVRGSVAIGGLAGATWRATSKIEIRGALGYEQREIKACSCETLDAVLLDSALIWRPSALTTITLIGRQELRSTTEEEGLSAVLVREGGAELAHAFRRNLTLTGGLLYAVDDYDTGREDQRIEARLGLLWQLNRHIAFVSDLIHSRRESSAPGEDESETEISAGLRLQY